MEKFLQVGYWTGLGFSPLWAAVAVLVLGLIFMGLHILKDAEERKNITDELKAQMDVQLQQAFDKSIGEAKAITDIHTELAELRKLVEQLALRLPKN